MPLSDYGVVAGRVADRRREGGKNTPHYQIHVRGGGVDFRVAVNVLSALPPSELLYVADEDFRHPMLAELDAVADGFTAVPSKPGGAALDFIRGNLFDRLTMRTLPPDLAGPDNDLADKLDHYVLRASRDPDSRLYAFGQRWGPEEGKPDKVFGFSPGDGIHDIHMNQGNSGRFTSDDGVWQDGAILIHFPAAEQWVAVFLAFQSQAWHTDDTTGHTLARITPPPPGRPTPGAPDHLLRIVAALVNPVGPAPEAETVTVLNTGVAPVDLAGWSIADRDGHRFAVVDGVLSAGETRRIPLAPPAALGNRGGIISLLDRDGLKVDGVSYTAADAAEEGRTVVF